MAAGPRVRHGSGVASLPNVPSLGPSPPDRALASEHVPELYRQILDLIVALEQTGSRRDAARARVEAIAAYSRGWDDAGWRRLEHIAEDLRRRIARSSVRTGRPPG